MESFESRKGRNRHAIDAKLDAFEQLLTEEVTERLSERDQSFATERQRYLEDIETLRVKSLRAEKLEEENSKLRSELGTARGQYPQGSDTSSNHRRLCSETSMVDVDEYNRVKDQLAHIDHDYGKLAFAHKVLESKVRHYKDTTKQWREYTERWILKNPKKQLKSLDALKASPAATTRDMRSSSAPAPPSIPNGITLSVSDISRSTSPWIGSNGAQNHPESSLQNDKGGPKALPDRIIATQLALSDEHRASSGNLTEASEESEPPIVDSAKASHELFSNGGLNANTEQVEDNDDSPIIVSERSLKRKRPVQVHDNGDISQTLAVKDEAYTSSPIHAPTSLPFGGAHDSLDLDDIGGHVHTPRKRQELEKLRNKYSIQTPARTRHGERVLHDINPTKDEDERPATPSQPFPPLNLVEENGAIDDRAQRRKLRKDLAKAQQRAHNDRVNERLEATQASPLRPIDPNAHIIPRTNEILDHQKRPCPPSRRDRSAAYVPALAEDGDYAASVSGKLQSKQVPSEKLLKVPDAYNRLGTLLSEPSPMKSFLVSKEDRYSPSRETTTSKTPLARCGHLVGSKTLTTPRSMPAKRSIPETSLGAKAGLMQYKNIEASMNEASISARAKPTSRKPPSFDQPKDAQPEHEPLRSRPLHRLCIDDFKLNPAHSDYGYHESIRKHDEKKSKSGCTDRSCPRCKDIRKFVENSGYAKAPGQDAEETDRRLIEKFLGDDWRRLNKMSAKERREILTQARVQEFADKFGKHRPSFGRAQSPVDYWNAGFPSTQEHEENLGVVRVRERDKVEEKYWEAIREGGRYVFADE